MANLNLNKVILGGRLVADIELMQSTSGRSIVQFTLAINRLRPSNEEEKADFIRCSAWDKTAELISKYFHKGDSILVCGSLRVNKYKDGVGRLVISSEINVDEALFVDSKKDKGETILPTNDRPDIYGDDVPF